MLDTKTYGLLFFFYLFTEGVRFQSSDLFQKVVRYTSCVRHTLSTSKTETTQKFVARLELRLPARHKHPPPPTDPREKTLFPTTSRRHGPTCQPPISSPRRAPTSRLPPPLASASSPRHRVRNFRSKPEPLPAREPKFFALASPPNRTRIPPPRSLKSLGPSGRKLGTLTRGGFGHRRVGGRKGVQF